MARISPLSVNEAPLWVRPAYWIARRTVKQLTGHQTEGAITPLAVTAHNRWVMSAYSFFETALQRSRRVDVKLKELARLKASTLTGCPW